MVEPVGELSTKSAWVGMLPKVELHLHLEGAVRATTVPELSRQRPGVEWTGPYDLGWEHGYYTYTDFASFMAQITPRIPYTAEDYARVAFECFEDLAAQQVVYAEVSFGAPVREVGDDSRFWPIAEAVEEARLTAESRWPMRINLIVGLMRSFPVEVGTYSVKLAADARDRGIGVVAIDLHGDEENFPPEPFEPAFRLAEEKGLAKRAHAGEARGPDSIWAAIEVLGVKRIAHGTRAQEDSKLIERLQEGDITLELCPTSNVRTGAVRDLASHPIRRYHDLGIPVTINSDDPLPFFTDISREYRLLVDEYDFEVDDLRQVTHNALTAAALPDDERRALQMLVQGAYQAAQRSTARVPA